MLDCERHGGACLLLLLAGSIGNYHKVIGTFVPILCLDGTNGPKPSVSFGIFHPAARLRKINMLTAIHFWKKHLCFVFAIAFFCGASNAEDRQTIGVGLKLRAKDTLAPKPETSQDALACLNALIWDPTDFEVRVEPADNKHGDWLLRFPSARPVGDANNDLVAVEWYQAKDKAKSPIYAPAAVIVHESGSGMAVGRLIAAGLSRKGVHTFMVQLPNYGKRRSPSG